MAVLAAPQMLEILSESFFVLLDVTFPLTHTFPYLLNVVAYNHTTLEYQVVTRVLMSKLTSAAYKAALEQILIITTNIHPEFDHGSAVKSWVVDFSEAQANGFAENLGKEKASQVIRGCNVHYMRNAEKTAVKVGVDECSREVFKKIAFKIPKLEKKSDVTLAFKILCGKSELDSALQFIDLTEKELDANTENWSKAKDWADWWQKERIIKMFAKSFKEMSDADWKVCPTTTNAVESHNKVSQTKTTLLLANLANYYEIDKNACTNTLLALSGIKIGDSEQTKKRKQENRVEARKRKRNANQNVDENGEIEESSARNENSASGRVRTRNSKKSEDDSGKEPSIKGGIQEVVKEKRGRGRPKKK